MKVFVAGATGVVGKRAVARLVAAGHEVTGVARSEDKAALLRSLGATPVTVDLFDGDAVRAAVAGHEAVVNLATAIPPVAKAAKAAAWEETERLRRDASRNLVEAALAAGVSRFVQESITFPYRDHGDQWIDEEAPVDRAPAMRATEVAEEETARFTAAGGTGVVLRFGAFYGPDSTHTRSFATAARNGIAPGLGDAEGFVSSIATDDAAAAVVAALRAPAGIYNVVDDEPLRRREHARALLDAVGARHSVSLPKAVAKFGGPNAEALARSQRVSNRKFRAATGWAPVYPSVREGFPVAVAQMDLPESHPWARIAVGLLAATSLVLGVWAQLAPRSFYDSFPGGGRHWVSADGPYNQHLVRDFGGMNLAMTLVLVVAVVVGSALLLRLAAAATLLFAVPHFAYHLGHLDVYGTADKIGNVVSLGLGVLLAVGVLVGCRSHGRAVARRAPRPAPAPVAGPAGVGASGT